MDVKILKSEFIYSVPTLSLMRSLNKELAVVGRSNAGKSSLINALCQKRDLARTSKTPGRTRHAVVYGVRMAKDEEEKDVTLVDLPGFGFASMSKTEAAECEALIFSYVRGRPHLSLLIIVLDIRRTLDERELAILQNAKEKGLAVLIVLTKCDKLALSRRKPVVNKMVKEFGLTSSSIVLHSTHDEKYTKELQSLVFNAL